MKYKWDKYRGQIYSSKGGWVVGHGIMTHGFSLLDDLHGKSTMFQVMMLNICGKLPDRRLADMLEALFICLSWPDPRIWCNKIGAFSAQTGSYITSAIAAGGLAGDSKMYGPGVCRSIGPFFRKAFKKIIEENTAVDIFIEQNAYKNGKLFAPGFARPLARGDERVSAMKMYAKQLGFEQGPYQNMIFSIEKYLLEKEGEALNVAGYFAAFMMDQGYSDDEITGFVGFSISGGIYAAYYEYLHQPPENFLPLRVDDIEYIGPAIRDIPDRD